MTQEESKEKSLRKRLEKMFPDRPDDKYAQVKIYNKNDVNQITRQAIINFITEEKR